MATVIPQVSIQDLVFKKSTPNTMGAINAGMALSNSFAEQQQAKRAEQAAAQQQQLAGQVSEGLLTGNQSPQEVARLMSQNPDLTAKLLAQAGIYNDAGREELGRTAFELRNMPAGPERDARIKQIAEQLKNRGGNPNIALGLIGLEGEEQNRQLKNMELTAMSNEQRQEVAEGNRDFDLDTKKFNLDAQNTYSQMSARAVDTGMKGERLRVDQQKLEIRSLEQQTSRLNTQVSQETNALKRDKLKIELDGIKANVAQKKRDIQFEAQEGLQGVQDIINTTKSLLKGDGLESASGASSMFPTLPGSSAADFEGQLETLKGQAFLASVAQMRGLGALGEKEGQRLVDAIGSLSLSMSDEKLRSEINRIQAKFVEAKGRLQAKYGKSPAKSVTLESLTDADMANMTKEQLEQVIGN